MTSRASKKAASRLVSAKSWRFPTRNPTSRSPESAAHPSADGSPSRASRAGKATAGSSKAGGSPETRLGRRDCERQGGQRPTAGVRRSRGRQQQALFGLQDDV